MNHKQSKAFSYLQKGNYAELTGDLNKALDFYNKAISCDSRNAEALYKAGFVNFRIGQLDTAVKLLEQCANIARNNTLAQYMHGRILHELGDMERAQRAFKLALKAAPDNLDAIAGTASVYEYHKQFEKAYKTIKPIIETRKVNHQISVLFARICHKVNACEKALKYIDTCLQSGRITDPDAISYLYYAAGDICDSTGDYSAAFDHFKAANDVRKLQYDSFSHANLVNSLKTIYSPAYIMEYSSSKSSTEKPVFIVGMPRSGTSLVEQILSSHSKVFGAGELTKISNIAGSITHKSLTEEQRIKAFRSLSSNQLKEFAKNYLDDINKLDGKAEYVVDKMPHNFLYLGLISQLFPKCRVIHCRRNPIDTCLSIYFKSFNDSHKYATDFESLAHQYKYYKEIMCYWKSILPIKIYDIHYEDIVTDLEDQTINLLEFCELNLEKECLEFYKTQRHVATASQTQVSRPIYKSSIGRWKNYSSQIQDFILLMESYGLIENNDSSWIPSIWAN